MIQKLEKLIDLAAEALSLYIDDVRRNRGEALPLEEKKERKPRGPNKVKEAAPSAPSAPASPFDLGGAAEQPAGKPAAAPSAKASVEDALEAKRRNQEVMGLFIRRYLKAQPTGLERTKKILAESLGRNIAKLEDLTYEDNVKLIPIFEAELEKAA